MGNTGPNFLETGGFFLNDPNRRRPIAVPQRDDVAVHADEAALADGLAALPRRGEMPCIAPSRRRGFFDLNGEQRSVGVEQQIDLAAVGVAVVVDGRAASGVIVAFQYLGDGVRLKKRARTPRRRPSDGVPLRLI
jgi:hypothetical protein